MASGVPVDHEDWSDTEDNTHEIIVDGTEITDQDDVRAEQVVKKSGPAWTSTESPEPRQSQETKKPAKYAAKKISEKNAPSVDTFSFPALNDQGVDKSVSKTELKSIESKDEKPISSNKYGALNVEEEDPLSDKKDDKKTSKKKQKKEWKKVEVNVKIASTTQEINSDTVFQKEPEKLPERVERSYEKQGFPNKSSGTGFRNYDNRTENGFSREVKSGVGFTRRNEGAEAAERGNEQPKSNVWRNAENAVNEKPQEITTSVTGPKKFFNRTKKNENESIDPLQPNAKVVETKKELSDARPKQVNPWRVNN